MKHLNCAIYLFGHGPRREPRLIELQHRTILRAIPWLEQHWQAHVVIGEVFVDINFPPDQPHENVAALDRLLRDVASKKYSHVLLNILSGSFPAEQHDWIDRKIEAAGATVCNLAYEEGPFIEHLVSIYGERFRDAAARVQYYNTDRSELLALFPALCASIAQELLTDDRLTNTSNIEHLGRIIRQLASENPYQNCLVPWPHQGTVGELHAEMHRKQEEEKSRRRASETLYKIGPYHEGLLREEGHYGVRSDESLAWAEQRLCDDLGFVRREEGRILSFQRQIDDILLFGDPRPQASLEFRAYRASPKAPAKPRDVSFFPAFKIPDTWKHALEEKLLRAVASLEPRDIVPFRPVDESGPSRPAARTRRRNKP